MITVCRSNLVLILFIVLAGADCELGVGRHGDFNSPDPFPEHLHNIDRLYLQRWTRRDGRSGHDSESTEPRRLVDDKRHRKVYAPKQNPRDYYLSEEYARSIATETERRMSSVYPQLEQRFADIRAHNARYRLANSISEDTARSTVCVRCPHARTLTLRSHEETVPLPAPRLFACGGRLAREARLVSQRGPRPGDALQPGRHVVVGKLFNNGQYLQTCRYRVEVVRMCVTPPELLTRCGARDTQNAREAYNARCRFSCADPDMRVVGAAALHCSDGHWSGQLPFCQVRQCSPPPPPSPSDGRVTCRRGGSSYRGRSLAHGSRCRVRCRHGLAPAPPSGTLCQHGDWTASLVCVNATDLYSNNIHRAIIPRK